jgi:hypothetical protein
LIIQSISFLATIMVAGYNCAYKWFPDGKFKRKLNEFLEICKKKSAIKEDAQRRMYDLNVPV